MVDKVFGADFTNETNPTGGMTISVNNGTLLVDVELQYLYKALGAAATQALLDLISTTQGVVLYHNGTDWVTLSPGTAGQVLKTGGAAANPSWGLPADLAMASQAQGCILYFNGTNWVILAPGTAGRHLQTNGAGANPTWALPADLAITSQAQGDVLYFNGTNWVRLAAGTSGQYLKTQGAAANPMWDTPSGGAAGLPAGHIYGLTLSNNGTDPTNDIDIATGKCRDSTDAVDIALASALTKRLDAAWAVGTNQGGLDTGSIADTTYHVWLIKRSDTGVVDVLFSTSATAPTMPTNYDYKRRIGSIIRASAAILPFSQNGDEFLLLTNVNSVPSEATSATAALKTMTVPTGIKVNAIISLRVDYASASTAVLITSPDQNDVAAATANQTVTVTSGSTPNSVVLHQRTNTSAQIRIRSSGTGATQIITTYGWVDTRGK